ncbi:MAG: C4-dicarboxylate ABC transporter permease [Arcobacter sp.]|jgi:TRAP-type mannitol/chloroaromatic compound transport system permease small subunit|uniref:TRAP transporter small permease subunit n=1 Tax=uncultured Arcobacter sp. TaxID=165434 RepID=UPI000CC5C006|nr:TRAP transporter small permease subunit [uncultured Arcobacter sp.]PLY10805.1 MAG: C4-dicarboxylate ABC transporter permease [Arcobacter sp.]
MLLKLERGFDKFANIIGTITAITMVLMILNVFYDVIMRYFFRSGSIAMQEMEWHLFSVIILLGISYTLKEDGHVRVDLIYDRLTDKKKAMINMVGVVTFILPIALLVGLSSIGNAHEAYLSMEQSGDPGGLPYRWIVKALIPLSFLLLLITSIGYFIKNLNIYKGLHPSDDYNLKGEIENLKCDLEQHKYHIKDIDEKGESK